MRKIRPSKRLIEAAKKLTPKQKKLVDGVVAGKGKRQAAIAAGYSPCSAHTRANEVLKTVKSDEYRTLLMEEHGLSIPEGLQGLKRSLHATKVISAMVVAPNGEGMKDAGSLTSYVEVPDMPTQLKAAIEVLDRHGFGPPKKATEANLTFETIEQRLKRLGLDG